jgi:site-specific DNA-methyltransferase (adenine-specific)
MKLYNGDYLEIMQELPDGSIDMVLCDPPYGTTACAWDSVIDFPKLWAQLNRVVKPTGAIVLFGSEPFSSVCRMSNIKRYKYDWLWDKKSAGNFMVAKYQPLKTFENIMVFGENINYYPQLQSGFENRVNEAARPKKSDFLSGIKSGMFFQTEKNKKGDERYPKAIIELSKQATECRNAESYHPTQKPVELLEYLIKTYTRRGETVLDFTMGSGSTGVACVNIEREFVGIELDKRFYDIAKKRIEAAQDNFEPALFDIEQTERENYDAVLCG